MSGVAPIGGRHRTFKDDGELAGLAGRIAIRFGGYPGEDEAPALPGVPGADSAIAHATTEVVSLERHCRRIEAGVPDTVYADPAASLVGGKALLRVAPAVREIDRVEVVVRSFGAGHEVEYPVGAQVIGRGVRTQHVEWIAGVGDGEVQVDEFGRQVLVAEFAQP